MNFREGAGGYVKKDVDVPLWISPVPGNNQVNMKDALFYAEKIINQWILERPNTPMPIIFYVSSGISCFERKEVSECRKEVIDASIKLEIMEIIVGMSRYLT